MHSDTIFNEIQQLVTLSKETIQQAMLLDFAMTYQDLDVRT